MHTNFTCPNSSKTLTISSFLDSNEEITQPRRYKAVRNGKENLVLHLFPVWNVQNFTSSTLCQGTPEADILPVLNMSRVPVTELVTMFIIEASGGDIVYRSRACVQLIPSHFMTGKCDSCIGLLENIKHREPGEKMEDYNVYRAELTCKNMECDIGDISDQDETRENNEAPRVIKFKRTSTAKVLVSCSA